jgi:hypothetical protein
MESGEFIMVLLSLFSPHLIYILLDKGIKLIDDYIYIIKHISVWLLYIAISYLYSPYIGVFYIMSYYLLTTYIITRINFSGKYFMLAVMLVLFQSEFWEIPIQLFYSPPMDIWLWGVAISRLLLIIEIIWILNDLKMDVEYFISNLVVFGMFYYSLLIFTYPLPIMRINHMGSNFIYRIICSLFFIGIIAKMRDMQNE